MDTRTGNWVEATDFREAMEKLQAEDPETQAKDVVMLEGRKEAVEELSRKVKAARMDVPNERRSV